MPLVNTNLRIKTKKPTRFDFDSVADTYDKWYETAEGVMYDRLEKKAISKYLLRNVQGRKLLEIGCGTGHWSQFFGEHDFEVMGVDVSERMISKALETKLQNTSFYIADGHFLPFKDGVFDVTAAIVTLEFVRDAELVVREMVRCTRKPGGQLLIGVLNMLTRLNRKRQQSPESLYAKARLFSPEQLKQLLGPYGRVHIAAAVFVPGQKWLLPLAPLTDLICRLLHRPSGVFIVAEVRL
ncbi:MAG: class I SAM-dependent methyltransferase [Planctomycetes bacterium]|nr:class I SAM-dependent methyltransferase [Planctomycetota bacterium]